jgi:glycosyltransferase involved in cell wall biosynthesis
MQRTLIITNINNPEDFSTWSGTPSNLINYFGQKGIIIKPVKTGSSRKINIVWIKLLNFVRGFGTYDYGRSPGSRRFSVKKLEREIKRDSVLKILHTSSFDIPFFSKIDNLDHYLYCDSTWDLRLRFGLDKTLYTKKMIRENEKIERFIYSNLKHIFSISEYVKKNLIEHYNVDPNKITVVGTGRNRVSPYFGEKDFSARKILFVANNRFEEKGGFLLLKAFSKILEQNSRIELTIVGDISKKKLIAGMRNIRVEGLISWSRLQELYNEACLFVMPALYEPWGIVYLEALSCKVPVVGLKRNSLPEITDCGKYGFLIEYPDIDLLARTILHAFENPQLLRDMGEKGQKYCLEKYSWDSVVNKIIEKVFDNA